MTRSIPAPRRLLLLAPVVLLAVTTACAPTEESTSGDAPPETADAAACTPDQLDLYADGVLTVGTDSPAYEPWFVDDDPTNGKGYESAVAYAVADKLGFDADQVDWTTVKFNASYQVGAKPFDFDVNQISITDKRAQAVTFSEPYYSAAQAVIVEKDSPYAEATSFADLADATFGAQIGTTSLEAVDQIGSAQDTAVYDDTNKATKALELGQIDALVADLPSAFYITAAVLPSSTVVGQFQPETGESEQFGLLLEKGNPLVSCLNTALGELRDDGTLADLEDQWLSQTTKVPELS